MTDLYTPGAEDFTQQISVLKKEGCELMVAVMLTPDFTNFWTQARQQSYQPVVPFGQKALIFPESVQALGEIGINLCCSGTWTPRSNFKDSLTGMTCQQLADEYEAFSGNQWSEAMIILTGFEWAADIFKRVTNVDDKEEYVKMITSTKLPCMLGTIDFTLPVKEMTYHPHPNVGVPPEAAGQWIKSAAGSKWPIDKVLIFTTSPDVIKVEARASADEVLAPRRKCRRAKNWPLVLGKTQSGAGANCRPRLLRPARVTLAGVLAMLRPKRVERRH